VALLSHGCIVHSAQKRHEVEVARLDREADVGNALQLEQTHVEEYYVLEDLGRQDLY
jgi:hypothetical protein